MVQWLAAEGLREGPCGQVGYKAKMHEIERSSRSRMGYGGQRSGGSKGEKWSKALLLSSVKKRKGEGEFGQSSDSKEVSLVMKGSSFGVNKGLSMNLTSMQG